MGRPPGIARAKVHYGQRYEVSAWIPPAKMAEIACERTEGMVGYFLSCCHRFNPVIWQDQLHNLARSCYMQGINDAAQAMTTMNQSSEERDAPQATGRAGGVRPDARRD